MTAFQLCDFIVEGMIDIELPPIYYAFSFVFCINNSTVPIDTLGERVFKVVAKELIHTHTHTYIDIILITLISSLIVPLSRS